MSGAVEKLVRDHELQGLVFFFKRTDRRNGHDPLHSQLLKPIHIRPKVQFCRQNPMPAPMPGKKRDLVARKSSEHVGIGGISEGRILLHLAHIAEPGYRIKPAAPDDSDFCLRQTSS